MHLDGDSVDSLLGELCSDPSLDSQRLLLLVVTKGTVEGKEKAKLVHNKERKPVNITISNNRKNNRRKNTAS